MFLYFSYSLLHTLTRIFFLVLILPARDIPTIETERGNGKKSEKKFLVGFTFLSPFSANSFSLDLIMLYFLFQKGLFANWTTYYKVQKAFKIELIN